VDCAVADQVLYFPYISVPSDAWFTRVLLYWDAVGSIVPAPYADAPERLTPYMQDLMAAQMIRPISPEAHNGALMEPLQDFFSWLDHDPVIRAGVHVEDRAGHAARRIREEVGRLRDVARGDVAAKGRALLDDRLHRREAVDRPRGERSDGAAETVSPTMVAIASPTRGGSHGSSISGSKCAGS